MSLNPTGSKPIINAKFDHHIISPGIAESGTCTLLIRKSPTVNWLKIATIHNSPFSSHNIIIDPLIHLGPGRDIGDLAGAEILYNVLFLDIDGDKKINCSFDLEVTQDGNIVYSKSDSKNTGNVDFVAFSHDFIL